MNLLHHLHLLHLLLLKHYNTIVNKVFFKFLISILGFILCDKKVLIFKTIFHFFIAFNPCSSLHRCHHQQAKLMRLSHQQADHQIPIIIILNSILKKKRNKQTNLRQNLMILHHR